MGLNVDLIQMLGTPKLVACPRCKAQVETGFDDYDIECGDPNQKVGEWKLRVYCDTCENDFFYEFTVRTEVK